MTTIYTSCSWCDTLNHPRAVWCFNCNHRAHLPRSLCDCTPCLSWRLLPPSTADLEVHWQ